VTTPRAASDLDPTGRFTDRAADYAKHRPTYPGAAVDAVLGGLAGPATLTAADVGAGTGIFARLLADRGVSVIAVEPNLAMRDAAAPHSGVTWREGTAEATGLPSGSVDLVVCAQAFHWFRRDEAIDELRRILRPGGRAALVWNERDPDDAATAAYGRLVEDAGAKDLLRVPPLGFGGPPRGFGPPREVVVPGHQELDLEGLLGRARSASYVPKSGPVHDAVMDGLRAVHARHADADGLLQFRYRTLVFLADRA
jgi:SAM-dependent methyltransferase